MLAYQCIEDKTFNDKWLIEKAFPNKQKGFYIELGASTGVACSTSYCLELFKNWDGISLEPNVDFYNEFVQNRNNPCLNVALAATDGEAEFVIPPQVYYSGLVRNVVEHHKEEVFAEGYRTTTVPTISFRTLLQRCPKDIDFISMDIEGSELECLETFPFKEYRVQCFIIEISDYKIVDFMLNHGYIEISNAFNTEAPWEKYFWLI